MRGEDVKKQCRWYVYLIIIIKKKERFCDAKKVCVYLHNSCQKKIKET